MLSYGADTLPVGDLDAHLTHGSNTTPKGISIGSAIFAGLANVTTDTQTNRLTDRLRYSVCSSRPLSLDAMLPKNGNQWKPNKTN